MDTKNITLILCEEFHYTYILYMISYIGHNPSEQEIWKLLAKVRI